MNPPPLLTFNYGRDTLGDRVVQDNLQAVRRGYQEVLEVSRNVMFATADRDKAMAALRVM